MIFAVINNYNYSEYLPEAVESVLNQRLIPDHTLAIDDDSTDDSVTLLKSRYSDRIEIITKSNGGQLSYFNELAGRVRDSDLIFFLDADDRFTPCHIEDCLSVYEQYTEVDYVFTRYQKVGQESGLGTILL